uniref:Uncharacterized protein n=1 Tax=Rhizophagus irregularis (strain DAOM 181602 / DAOM 197198 / MUCL 43194) TaxID=747089 RepID=U9SZP7_RHIID
MGDSMGKVYRDVVNHEYSSQTNLLIKILENTDHRQPKFKKEIEQIYSLEFIENDEKLLIIGKSLEGGLKFIIWDLYDTVDEKEPWVLDEYDRQSYCIYQNKNGDETETLQLIVGRSTVQIWHQIQDDGKKTKMTFLIKGNHFLNIFGQIVFR